VAGRGSARRGAALDPRAPRDRRFGARPGRDMPGTWRSRPRRPRGARRPS